MQMLIDTGAMYSVIGGEIAEDLRARFGLTGHTLTMSTRLGGITCQQCIVPVTFVADGGHDLELDATIMLSASWDGPGVIGYLGLLERIHFGFAPASNASHADWFCFGLRD